MPESKNMADNNEEQDLLILTADIVAAFVANNSLKPDELPRLIAETHASLVSAAAPTSVAEPANTRFTPAVSVRKSLAKREVILSMIDGKPYRTLKRHLAARGLTPADYRARYNLPADYPMVAPAYSEARRETAKRLGLGRLPKTPNAGKAKASPGRARRSAK